MFVPSKAELKTSNRMYKRRTEIQSKPHPDR